jgi:hypothetical protein
MHSIYRTIVFLGYLATTSGAQQHLRFDGDAETYEMTFDDSRISVSRMRQIAPLSPFVENSHEFQIGMGSVKMGGKDVRDKVFMAPELDLCIDEPGKPCPLNDAYFAHADRALKQGSDQLAKLRKEELPAQLEPVRTYLAHGLEHSLQMNRARYEYLKSGNMAPMRQLLCDACPCANETELLKLLDTARNDPATKLKLSWLNWQNEIVQCQRNHSPYPMEAWKNFVAKFGITEQRKSKHID